MFFDVGDLVTRNSHSNDIIFRVVRIKNDIAILESLNDLIIADCHISDLRKEEKVE